MQDTSGSNPLWTDSQLNDELAAALGWYSQYFPNVVAWQVTSSANQTAVVTGLAVLQAREVTIDGVTVARVPDAATLYEPALRNTPSQSQVQPVTNYGAAASHGQAWALVDGVIMLRYPLSAGRTVAGHVAAAWTLPSDDLTPAGIPDQDVELIVLDACDRLWRSYATDMEKRGMPGARDDAGYRRRADAALRARRGHVKSATITVLQ
jgi:hypothetical protein